MTSPTEYEISDLYNRLLFTTKYADAASMKRCIEKLGYDHHDSFEAMISGLTDKQLQIVFDSYDEARQPTHFKLPKPYFYNILPPSSYYRPDAFIKVYQGHGKITEEEVLCLPIVSFTYRVNQNENIVSVIQSGFINLNSDKEIVAGVEYWSRWGKFIKGDIFGLTFVLSTALLKRSDWLISGGFSTRALKPEDLIHYMQNYDNSAYDKDIISFDEPISLDYVEILVCPDKEVKKFSKIVAESDYKHIQVVSRSNFSKQKYLRSVKKVRRLYYDA